VRFLPQSPSSSPAPSRARLPVGIVDAARHPDVRGFRRLLPDVRIELLRELLQPSAAVLVSAIVIFRRYTTIGPSPARRSCSTGKGMGPTTGSSQSSKSGSINQTKQGGLRLEAALFLWWHAERPYKKNPAPRGAEVKEARVGLSRLLRSISSG
jgi:hypothetical protein